MSLIRRLFDRKRFDALRRRIAQAPLNRYCRATETKLHRAGPLPQADIRQILICRPNHRLGNQIMLTPLITELQSTFPYATIDIVVAGEMGLGLFDSFPQVRNVYRLRRRMVKHPVATVRTVRLIRGARYDLAIDPCRGSQSGRLLLSLAIARYVIGLPAFDPKAPGQVNRDGQAPTQQASTQQPPIHMAQWPVFLLQNALSKDCPEADGNYPPLTIGLSDAERTNARQTIDSLASTAGDCDTTIVVGISADATGAKRYDESWWLRFIEELKARHADYAIVEIAPPDGRSRLSSKFPMFSSSNERIVAAVISNMTCFICADGGVMHLASASGTPTIGLFCATEPALYAPYGGCNMPIETNGKAPEVVARAALSVIEVLAGDKQWHANAQPRRAS